MSDRSDKREDKGFVVNDRRIFDADGNYRDETVPRESAPAGAATAESAPRESAPAGAATAESAPRESAGRGYSLPEMDFSTFILSLSTSAMVHLGEVPEPDGSTHKELPLAKQAIDILGILKDKTSGNLTADEQHLLDDLLCDLRLRFVEASRAISAIR